MLHKIMDVELELIKYVIEAQHNNKNISRCKDLFPILQNLLKISLINQWFVNGSVKIIVLHEKFIVDIMYLLS